MFKLIFKFDGTDVGCIDEYITEKYQEKNSKNKFDKIKISIQNDLILSVYKYKNKFPLIINELKKYFCVLNINYDVATIEGDKYLIYQNLNNRKLLDYVQNIDIKNEIIQYRIQKIFIFNYLMCINSNFEKNILVFSDNLNPFITDMKNTKNILLKFIKEKSFKLDISKHEISKVVLDKYFNGSLELFRKITKEVVDEIEPDSFRQEALKIVRKYDESYIPWVNNIYENIKYAKGF